MSRQTLGSVGSVGHCWSRSKRERRKEATSGASCSVPKRLIVSTKPQGMLWTVHPKANLALLRAIRCRSKHRVDRDAIKTIWPCDGERCETLREARYL